jgi:3-hydroxybutyryl-CoA dehydratase
MSSASANGQLQMAGGFEDLEIGQSMVTRGRTITESDLVGFSALTGDWHPQHADAEWAAGSRFGERIAHGMMVLSYAVGLVPFDPERIVALRGFEKVSFKRPTRIGDTIRVQVKVAGKKQLDDEHGLVTFQWKIVNQEGKTACQLKVDALWKIGAGSAGGSAGEGDTTADPAAAASTAPASNGTQEVYL